MDQATTVPARHLGGTKPSAEIAVGHPADLVLLRGDPLADIAHTRQIERVVLRGAWLPRARLDAVLVQARAAGER